MQFLTNGEDRFTSATGLYGVSLSRVLSGDEKVELRDSYGRKVHAFTSPASQDLADLEDPESTGKAIMLTTQMTDVFVTDHSGDKLIVTFSINKV
jgi:hypothetical protein